MENFIKICNNIFKFIIICYDWKTSKMWFINAYKYVEKSKNYCSNSSQNESLLSSFLFCHFYFQKIVDIQYDLKTCNTKIQRQIDWSDSARDQKFNLFVVNFKEIITNSIFKKSELKVWRNKKINKLYDRQINRKCLRFQQELKLIKKMILFEIVVKR